MDVKSLQDYVRQHLELDEDDLPDALLNVYLQDAFDRTMALSNRWPRYEKEWSISQTLPDSGIVLPAECSIPGILSVISVTDGYRLVMANQENAESAFLTGNTTVMNGIPAFYSVFGYDDNNLPLMWLWPRPAESVLPYILRLRGYRQPVWSEASSAIPDLDSRLHLALAYYAMALVYAAQEDEILEGVYMSRWQRDCTQQIKMILEPAHHRPLVLNSGNPIGGVPSYVVIPPTQ